MECVSDVANAQQANFASITEAHLDDVYRYLLYMTANPSTAEDLTSETFERALARWTRFDARRGSAQTWLCQIARSAALDHFRSEERRRRRELNAARREGATAAEIELPDEYGPVLRQALRTLTAADREVIARRGAHGAERPSRASRPHRGDSTSSPQEHRAAALASPCRAGGGGSLDRRRGRRRSHKPLRTAWSGRAAADSR
jgi:RNA polymerase sigma factor (sigma-70 family)